MPFLNDLHASTRETVHLAILQGVDVVYIEKLARLGSPALPSRVGGRMWPYCTAVGKALLAFSSESLVRTIVTNGFERRTPYTIVAPNLLLKQLQEIRGRGIAYDWQESTVGVTCIASPVLDSAGEPIAAVSVSGSSNRLYGDRLEAIVQATARRVSQRLMANAIRWPSVGAAQNELSNSAHRSRVTA
jgi:DNA-binding IclR family transcriptional regulator